MEIYSLRQLIQEGRYEIQADLVAEAIVRSWRAESELYAPSEGPPSGREAEQLHFEGLGREAITPTDREPGPPGVYGRRQPPPFSQP